MVRGNPDTFERVNTPRIEKIHGFLENIAKSAKSNSAPAEHTQMMKDLVRHISGEYGLDDAAAQPPETGDAETGDRRVTLASVTLDLTRLTLSEQARVFADLAGAMQSAILTFETEREVKANKAKGKNPVEDIEEEDIFG